ncbi:MAG: pseudaminic acid cytidylyltransferase [Pelagibacterium sp. SCN 64-44]|nr:MAG: pseudaminic acid cytidylyltransferase [Pelagibacterium sp. SCN 64-44]
MSSPGLKLAVIPARGGSKRIPGKNIKAFAGKPMIAYAIEGALASGVFDHVIVSTDDAAIAEIARATGAEVPFMRPADLSDDFTPTVPVIAHAITAFEALKGPVAQACCIYAGVPLLEAEDLRNGLDLLLQGGTDYVFPVAAFPAAIQRALRRAEDGTTRPFHPEYATTRTQDLEPGFYDAGQFYWGLRDAWLAGLTLHTHGKTIVLPEWRVVDIDTPEDWARAELMFRAIKGAASE